MLGAQELRPAAFGRGVALVIGALAILNACGARSGLAFPEDPIEDASPGEGGHDGDGVCAAQEMALVSAGPFLMGCIPDVPPHDAGMTCSAVDVPLHEVTLSQFEIDETEVTQSAYQSCVDAGACAAQEDCGSDWLYGIDPTANPCHPMTCVDWAQAVGYCEWLGKRLPTEAEWEKSARGTDERRYPWGNEPPDCARVRFAGCPDGDELLEEFEPVGSHPSGASPYGVFDMVGNAQEWTHDWWGSHYYEVSPSIDPTGPTDPEPGLGGGPPERVTRGWDTHAIDPWLSARFSDDPLKRRGFIGFRCVR